MLLLCCCEWEDDTVDKFCIFWQLWIHSVAFKSYFNRWRCGFTKKEVRSVCVWINGIVWGWDFGFVEETIRVIKYIEKKCCFLSLLVFVILQFKWYSDWWRKSQQFDGYIKYTRLLSMYVKNTSKEPKIHLKTVDNFYVLFILYEVQP